MQQELKEAFRLYDKEGRCMARVGFKVFNLCSIPFPVVILFWNFLNWMNTQNVYAMLPPLVEQFYKATFLWDRSSRHTNLHLLKTYTLTATCSFGFNTNSKLTHRQWSRLYIFSFRIVVGNGYITTAVLKEILRELDETLCNDDLDAMIEGED